MNGLRLKTGILLASLCLGSSALFADSAHKTHKTHQGSGYMLLETTPTSKGNLMLLLQTKNGDKVKVIVPKSEVKKLRGARHGDSFMLWEREGTLQRNKHPYTNY